MLFTDSGCFFASGVWHTLSARHVFNVSKEKHRLFLVPRATIGGIKHTDRRLFLVTVIAPISSAPNMCFSSECCFLGSVAVVLTDVGSLSTLEALGTFFCPPRQWSRIFSKLLFLACPFLAKHLGFSNLSFATVFLDFSYSRCLPTFVHLSQSARNLHFCHASRCCDDVHVW